MATTSTNKQPLFVDRVLHYAINLDKSANSGLDVTSSNTAALLVDATQSDGAIIEDIYLIARGTNAHTVNLYLSTARDYLRPNEANFIGKIEAPVVAGTSKSWEKMPITLTPVPHVGDKPSNRAFLLPKGYALWAARDGNTDVSDGPIIACQGGWY